LFLLFLAGVFFGSGVSSPWGLLNRCQLERSKTGFENFGLISRGAFSYFTLKFGLRFATVGTYPLGACLGRYFLITSWQHLP
jgi:hypothetical protein